MRAPWLLIAVVALGCTRRESGVEPTLRVAYAYVDRDRRVEGQPAYDAVEDKAAVLVGLPIHVEGYFAATCSSANEASWTRDSNGDPDKYPRHYRECDREATDVAITCAGPCTVRGPYVTPTAPGALSVAITLTSRDAARVQRYVRSFHAVAAAELELRCGKDHVVTTPDAPARCATSSPSIGVGIRAGDATFGAPLTINGEAFIPERDATTISLARLFGHPPGTPMQPAPGVYRLDVRYRDLARVVDVELTEQEPAASQPTRP